MSADQLRRAAAQMRDGAQGHGIPDSPWLTQPSWDDPSEADVKAHDPQMPTLPYDVASELEPRLAAHIASWHPAVALAVADWLADEAAGAQTATGQPTAHALAVARAYLGEAS